MTERYASLKQGLVGCWIPSISGSGLLLPDLSGRGNNGSLVGMDASDWVSSQYGRALDFDGVNDEINYGTNISLGGEKRVSFSAWIYRATQGQVFAFTRYNTSLGTGNVRGDLFGTNNATLNGQVALSITNSLTVNDYLSFYSTQQVPAAQWTHIAATAFIDGNDSTCNMWINGVAATVNSDHNGTRPTAWQANSSVSYRTSRIIGFGGSSSYTSGIVDDLRVYNRALSEPEIRLLASEPGIGFKPAKKLSRFSQRFTYKPPKPRNYSVIRNRDPNVSTLRHGLVAAYCPSISGQGNVLPDLVGGNHGTLTNMTADDWVSSGDGRALDFDGVNDYVDFGNSIPLPGVKTISVSGWVYQSTLSEAACLVRYNTSLAGSDLRRDYIGVGEVTAKGQLLAIIQNAIGGNNYLLYYCTNTITQNQWNHVAISVVIDGASSSAKIFLNGISQSVVTAHAGTAPTSFAANNSVPYTLISGIGGGGSRFYYAAILDDVRYYNRALSESEIKLLASKRGIGLEPRKPKITFTDLGVQKTYSVVRVKETDYGTLRQGLVGAWCPSLPNGGSGNTLPDQSGYNNHGTLTNMSPDDWVSGQYGRVLDFDNTDDYVSCSSQAVQSLASGTISFWIKTSKEVGAAFTIQQTTSTSEAFGVGIGQNWTGFFTNELVTIYRKSNNSISRLAGYTTATRTELLDNNWHHVVVKCDGAYQLFVDGISKTLTFPGAYPTNDGAFTSGLSNLTSLYFGGYRDGAAIDPINGQMDDVRVYSRGLTESEIRLLASRPGIGLRQESHRNTFYQFPSGSRRKRILTGMP